jgi:hypothetical protein
MSVGNNASFLSDVDGTDAHNMNEFRMKGLLVSSMKINDRGVLYIRPFPHTSADSRLHASVKPRCKY